MSRVLLFVASGDARPKCVGNTTAHRQFPRYPLLPRGHELHGRWLTFHQDAAVSTHHRWWPVECANARNGREVISMSLPVKPGTTPVAAWPRGRIVASGGAR